MSTTQSPQDEILAIQATLELHAEDLERIKQQLPAINDEARRQDIEQATAQSVADHQRIEQELQAIRERLDALERAQSITTREIADIKAGIARIDGEIAGIKDEIANIKEQLSALWVRTDALIALLDDMSRTLTAIDSRLGNIAGTRYERRVARRIRRRPIRTAIGLSQVQQLHTDWGETDAALLTLLSDADAISDDEYEDLLDADIILAGQNAAGQRAYAVIEIGITVSSADVNRAARRARALASATGAPCNAVVVGSEIPDAERQRAARTEVAIIPITERTD